MYLKQQEGANESALRCSLRNMLSPRDSVEAERMFDAALREVQAEQRRQVLRDLAARFNIDVSE
jgi:hypothetical protein